MRSFLGAPLLHFFVLGCALHVVEPAWRARFGPRPVIVVTGSQQALLRTGFEEQFGRPPSPSEEAALVERAIEEEVLFRQAIELGFDRENPFVDYRLATLVHFLDPEKGHDEAARVADARNLGLDRTDLVVRRQLVETLRLLYKRPPQHEPPPSGGEIEATYRREAERSFRRPASVAFAHVYFSRSRRGESVEQDARQALARIHHEALDPARARRLGDPFLLGAEFPLATPRDLESRIGRQLAAGIASAPIGEWTGPLPSAWGLHLVLVRERKPGGIQPLSEVRDRVLVFVRAERAERRLRDRIASLRSRYEIRIEKDAG